MVLIIDILAAIAVPQYQKTVERVWWTEAVLHVRAIAQAHQAYYMANGTYVSDTEMEKLSIELPRTLDHSIGQNRILIKNFIYSPPGRNVQYLALAQWADQGKWDSYSQYYLYVLPQQPSVIHCGSNKTRTLQDKICKSIEINGTL